MNLYSVAEAYALDQATMKLDALADGELMARAGEAAFRLLRLRWPRAKHFTIVCGPGNNGGDGYVVADRLIAAGLQTTVVCLGNLTRQAGDALPAREQYQASGGALLEYKGGPLPTADVVVDALLGIGVRQELGGLFAEVVMAMNSQSAPVLALDIPSGINADTGAVLGRAVHAQATLSFIGVKRGVVTGAAVEHTGDLYATGLGVSTTTREQVQCHDFLLTDLTCCDLCPTRKRDTHKGQQGRVLVLGGAAGMTGAAVLAGTAALHAGAGLVRLAVRRESIGALPELMVHHVEKTAQLEPLLDASNVLVLGPGLGRDEQAQRLLGYALEMRLQQQALVLDADALHCLAQDPLEIAGAIVTPHPGEAAALLGCTSTEVQQDRYSAAKSIARRYNGVCVLKGAGTVISDGFNCFVCDRGHPAMASAGTGDVLAGTIAALLGQGLAAVDAARLGVYIHGLAGERAARHFGAGMTASDLSAAIPEQLVRLCPS